MVKPSEDIFLLMTKKSVDAFVSPKPFAPFEARMVDGQRFRFRNIEEFIVGRDDIAALRRNGTIMLISIGLISTLRPLAVRGQRRRRA
jgi:hypothetical protein